MDNTCSIHYDKNEFGEYEKLTFAAAHDQALRRPNLDLSLDRQSAKHKKDR